MPPLMWEAAALTIAAVAWAAARQRHPVAALLAGALCGLAALSAVAVLEPLTGITLPLNAMTGFFAAVLGLPGVVALLVLQWLFLL